jgi:hypothetical protein
MIAAQLFERCPFLAAVTDVLPFIFANWTARRRSRTLGKLRPALHADEILHRQKIIYLADVTMLKKHRDEGPAFNSGFADCGCAVPLRLRRAESERGRFVWTDTWIRRDGRWQIVAAEDLIAPEKAE